MNHTKILVATEEDFDWVYKLANKDKDELLGVIYPVELRDAIAHGEMLVNEGKSGFCEIHYSKKNQHVSIYKIFVAEACRQQSVIRAFIKYIQDNYAYPIRTTCKANTPVEEFWKRVAKKVESKHSKKGTELSVYMIGEPVRTLRKETLF